MTTNSIGSQQFISLRGAVQRPSEQVLGPMVRPGVDGIGLWKTGVRGRPFRLRSMVDSTDTMISRSEFVDYRALIGGDLQILIQDGYNFNIQESFKVEVLDVQLLELKEIVSSVGGLVEDSAAKLVCEWTLIAVANTI